MEPRAWRVAIRAERPVPVAERAGGPGATTTASLAAAPTPCHGSAICTMLTPAIWRFSGWAHGSCSRAATRIRSPTAESSRAIMEPTEYPAMSGSNTICVATVLLETGMVELREPETTLRLEAPGGVVEVRAAWQ